MRPFDYYQPQSFEEAFEFLALPGSIPLAGATDVIPMVRDGHWAPDAVVDLKGLPGLREIEIAAHEGCGPGECLYVGAAARMNEIARSELVRSHWDLLAQGAASMGNEQVRNRATLGGNLCTASPAADSAPALLALEAHVLIRGPEGERSVRAEEFFTGPRRTVLVPGEIVVGVAIPKPPEGSVGRYEKLSRRKAADLSIVGVAALAVPNGAGYSWRIALGAVAPTPIRSSEAEAILNQGYDDAAIDEAASGAYDACCPITDIRASADYRRAMITNVSRRAIRAVAEQIRNR